MKLINKEEDINNVDLFESSSSNDEQIKLLSDELRLAEDKFYKVFDLNPCPMAISDINENIIIDVNDAFVKVIGLTSKLEVIGKDITEKGLKIIKRKDKEVILKEISETNKFKNYFSIVKPLRGKKFKGLFSGSLIELNGRKCLFTICQVVNKQCFLDFITLF